MSCQRIDSDPSGCLLKTTAITPPGFIEMQMEKEVTTGIGQFNAFTLRFVAAFAECAAAAPPPPLFLAFERQPHAACSSSSDGSDDGSDDDFHDARDVASLSGGSDDERRAQGVYVFRILGLA